MPNTGPRPWARHPRPHVWITGPDPLTHVQYRKWLQQRNQAQWRGETWSLGFDAWREIWGPLWPKRGRNACDLCMVRVDPDQPWQQDNVTLVTRQEHSRRQGHAGLGSRRPRRRPAHLS